MRYVGYSEFFHDSGMAIINDRGEIEFASQSERYSNIKNDNMVHPFLVDMIEIGNDILCYHESPPERQKYHANKHGSFKYRVQDSLIGDPFGSRYIKHHMSHAATAYYTRPWEDGSDTVIMTIDGVGEVQSAAIYNNKFELLHEMKHPTSIGLLYAEITKRLGLKPLEEEYIVMGMSAYGQPLYTHRIMEVYRDTKKEYRQQLQKAIPERAKEEDIAASIQKFAELAILEWAETARKYGSKLCYAGGVAQNIIANSIIRDLFDDVWIAPCPTDGGSSLGTAAYHYCKDKGVDRVKWQDAYLGFDMQNDINPKHVAEYLVKNQYCGLASGRAEFGPRALGNRSLIADPRADVKNTVNQIKRRQKFRPFAPAILEEYADQYFEGHTNQYMQYTSKALHDYSSVTHVDGTARVQLVPENSRSIFRKVIEEFYELTGVPMLLNTSLNVRGKPIVNDKYQAFLFQTLYNTKVFFE